MIKTDDGRYEKSLARRVVGASVDLKAPDKLGAESADEPAPAAQRFKKAWSKFTSTMSALNCFASRKKIKDAKQTASMGKVLNLMRNDVYEVSQRFWDFPSFITTPLNLIFSVVLVWKLVGWPCFLGLATIVVAELLNIFFTKILLGWERKRRTVTDKKLSRINGFIGAIRHLRWYGWQEHWLENIMETRREELKLRVTTSLFRILVSFINQLASNMFPVAAFFAYTYLAGEPLRVDVAFPALQLFNMLESSLRGIPDLITTILNAKIAIDRVEDFMAEPDKSDGGALSVSKDMEFGLEKASFAWPETEQAILKEVTVSFPTGISIICGKVATGKSALLQALLGEMDCLQGQIIRPAKMIGYCAQTPWLQSMSIRDNILFSFPYEEARYDQVIEACALKPDFALFKHGDLSNIGENGIGLSGGQRARVALARAVYSRAPILLLDDPLSALDHQTAESIVLNCFKGPLMEGRVLVLVTHRVDICLPVATQVIEVKDGACNRIDSDSLSGLTLGSSQSQTPVEDEIQKTADDDKDKTPADKFIEDEHRANGGVVYSVYWEYIKAGKLKFWAISILIIMIFRSATIGRTWFLKEWGEAYDKPVTESSIHTPIDDFPSPEKNITPWLLGFFIFGTVQSIMYAVSQAFMIVIVYTAGKGMFQRVLYKVAHAAFRFYDVTPIGRLMNRMTSDISTMDGNISHQFQFVAWLGISWVTNVVVIASVTPSFLAFSFGLAGTFVYVFLQFLPTSQSLRRLEMVSLSPLMSNFGTLLEGLSTVRAFRVQSRFQDRLIGVVDLFQKNDHFYWAVQSWLQYRFDALSATATFILTLLALWTNVSAGLTAFVLSSAASFVSNTHGLCRLYGRLQMDFVSVERVMELLNVDQEPPGSVDPPAAWPSFTGDVVFEGVTIRYAPHLDPSLHDISFRIPAGSTTALLGRTGSGKSTLALSLLATIAPEAGKIIVDSIDISEVSKQALRHRLVSIINL